MRAFLLPALFFLSAFFSATETAFFALRRTDFLRWKEEGDPRAALIERLLESPSRLIATIFIGNEIVNVAISSLIAAFLIPRFPGHGALAALVAGTLGILILGDITPKCIAWPRAPAVSLAAARPLYWFSRLIAPLRFLMEALAAGALRLLGVARAPDRAPLTEREFRALVDVGEEAGTLDPGEKELIHNIFEMTDRRAGEIMTPLVDVFMVPSDLPYGELMIQFRRYRRSRIPVYEGERSDIVGVLHFKELLRRSAEDVEEPAWRDLVRPPFVVPASKKLPLLLREFQERKIHLAIVADGFGEPVGIVTLEDVLEELFGEIREERDLEEREVVRRADGTSLVLGKMSIRRFNGAFGAEFPERESETVSGLMLHEFGRLPGKGESIVLGSFRFTVERLKGIRIVEVGVRPVPRGKEGA